MSKEVRLNDKMWFSKYQGKTIKFIIENDKSFIDSLIKSGKIHYSDSVIKYINGKRDYKKKIDVWDNYFDSDF